MSKRIYLYFLMVVFILSSLFYMGIISSKSNPFERIVIKTPKNLSAYYALISPPPIGKKQLTFNKVVLDLEKKGINPIKICLYSNDMEKSICMSMIAYRLFDSMVDFSDLVRSNDNIGKALYNIYLVKKEVPFILIMKDRTYIFFSEVPEIKE